MRKVNAIVIRGFGAPADVIRIEEQTLPEPGPRELLVEMRAAPINPVDLNVLEGKYPVLPDLPGVPGSEGAGIVTQTGAAVSEFAIGDQVMLANRTGSWREACVVEVDDLIAVPAAIPPAQAAMLKINPATAWRMLHDFVTLRPGDWVIQNAANSGVGRAVIQIAARLGIQTLNIVRRQELEAELLREGATAVLVETDNLRDRIKAIAGPKFQLALNAVGGESALQIANALAPGGTIVTYGAMGRQPLRIPNGLLIFKDLRWRGFWVTQWYAEASRGARDAMFAQLFEMAEQGILKTQVQAEYPITEARAAIQLAQQGSRAGKVLFRF